jgi:hypothetical protein
MGDFFITSITDVNCPYAIYPGWSFRDRETQILSSHRTQGGRLFSYLWGRYFKYQIPLRFVDSAGQNFLNSWWRNQETVALTLDSSETEATVLCNIVNRTTPIDKFVQPYSDLFEGVLRLEAVDDAPKTRRPFILDDFLFGLLDQDFNAILG